MTQIRDRWSTDQLITGIETMAWLRLLQGIGYDVSPEYLHRAAWIGALSLPATVLGRIEDARYSRELSRLNMPPPLFVLGHWRSGTTHLHTLLGQSPDHTFPTVFQVVFPTAFLTAAPVIPRLTARLIPSNRTYDNVAHGWDAAAEDEIALAKLTGQSPYLSFMFPSHAARYERYVDFLQASPDERDQWLGALDWFLRKVSLASGGKRVVCKSCGHTARVRLLLEAFPDARFVYIHRNPFEVFASTLHMRAHTDWENFFQVPDGDPEVNRRTETLALGRRLFERWAKDRQLIADDRLVEIAYDDLAGHEHEVMGQLWTQLDLPRWAETEPILRRHVADLAGYRRNVLSLSERDRDDVRHHWREAFETYGYDLDDGSRT